MKLFRRGPVQPQEPTAIRYEHVRATQGRKAHLRAPGSSPGVLCGWPGPWVPAADPSMPVWRMCEDRAGASNNNGGNG